jgi:hypothetical protein
MFVKPLGSEFSALLFNTYHYKTRSSGKNKSPTFFDTTRIALKTTCPTIILLLRVYSLQR